MKPTSPQSARATLGGGGRSNHHTHAYATDDPLEAQREHLLEQVRRREVAIIRAIVRGEVNPSDVQPSVLLTARGIRDTEVEEELKRSHQLTATSAAAAQGGNTTTGGTLLPLKGGGGGAHRDAIGPKMVAPLKPRPPPGAGVGLGGDASMMGSAETDGLFVRKGADRVSVLFGVNSNTNQQSPSSPHGHHSVASPSTAAGLIGGSSPPSEKRFGQSFINLASLPIPKPNAPPLDVALTWEDVWPRGASLYANSPSSPRRGSVAGNGGGGGAGTSTTVTPSKGQRMAARKKTTSSEADDTIIDVNFDILSAGDASPITTASSDSKGKKKKAKRSALDYEDAAHSSFADTLPVLMQRWKEGARRLVHPPTIYLPSFNPDELNIRVQTTNTINNTLFGLAAAGGQQPSPSAAAAAPSSSSSGGGNTTSFGLGGLAMSNASPLAEAEFPKVRQICEAVDRVLLFNRGGGVKPATQQQQAGAGAQRGRSPPDGKQKQQSKRGSSKTNDGATSVPSDANPPSSLQGPSGVTIESPQSVFGANPAVHAQLALDESINALIDPVRGHFRDLQALTFALHDVAAVGFQRGNAVSAAVMLCADQIRMSLHKVHKAWRDDEGPIAEAKVQASRVRQDMLYMQREATSLRRTIDALEQQLSDKNAEIARLQQRSAGTDGSAALHHLLPAGALSPPPGSASVGRTIPNLAAVAEARTAMAAYSKGVQEKAQRQRDEAAWEVVSEEERERADAAHPKFALSARRVGAKVAAIGRARRRPVETMDAETSCEDLYFNAFNHKMYPMLSHAVPLRPPTAPTLEGGSGDDKGRLQQHQQQLRQLRTFRTASGRFVSPYASSDYNLFMPRDDMHYTVSPEAILGPSRERMTRLGARLVAQACAAMNEHAPNALTLAVAEANGIGPSSDSRVWSAASASRGGGDGRRVDSAPPTTANDAFMTAAPITGAPPPPPPMRFRFNPTDIFQGIVNALESITGRRLTESAVYSLVQRTDLAADNTRETQTSPMGGGPSHPKVPNFAAGLGKGRGNNSKDAASGAAPKASPRDATAAAASNNNNNTATPRRKSTIVRQSVVSITSDGNSGGNINKTSSSSSLLLTPKTAAASASSLNAGGGATVRGATPSPYDKPAITSPTMSTSSVGGGGAVGSSHAKQVFQQIPQLISVTNAFKSSKKEGGRSQRALRGANGGGGSGVHIAVDTREMATVADHYTVELPRILKQAPLTLEHLLTSLVPSFEEAIEDGMASVVLRGSSGCEDASSPFFYFVSQDNLRSTILETLMFLTVEQIASSASDAMVSSLAAAEGDVTDGGGSAGGHGPPLSSDAAHHLGLLGKSWSSAACRVTPLGTARLLYETLVLQLHAKHGGISSGVTLAWLNAIGVAMMRSLTRGRAQYRLRREEAGCGSLCNEEDINNEGDGIHNSANTAPPPQPSELKALLGSLCNVQYGIGKLWEMEHIVVVHGNERVMEAPNAMKRAQLKVEAVRAAYSQQQQQQLQGAQGQDGLSARSSLLATPSAAAVGGGGAKQSLSSAAGRNDSAADGRPKSVVAALLLSAGHGSTGGGGGGSSSRTNSILSAHEEARRLSVLSSGALLPLERVSSQLVTAMFLRWAAGGFLNDRRPPEIRSSVGSGNHGSGDEELAQSRSRMNSLQPPSLGGPDVFLPDSEAFTATSLIVFVSLLHATLALLDGPRVELLFQGTLYLEPSEALVLLSSLVPIHVLEAAAYAQQAPDKRPDELLKRLLTAVFEAPLPLSFRALSHVGNSLHWDTFVCKVVLLWDSVVEPIYAKASTVLLIDVRSLRPWRMASIDVLAREEEEEAAAAERRRERSSIAGSGGGCAEPSIPSGNGAGAAVLPQQQLSSLSATVPTAVRHQQQLSVGKSAAVALSRAATPSGSQYAAPTPATPTMVFGGDAMAPPPFPHSQLSAPPSILIHRGGLSSDSNPSPTTIAPPPSNASLLLMDGLLGSTIPSLSVTLPTEGM